MILSTAADLTQSPGFVEEQVRIKMENSRAGFLVVLSVSALFFLDAGGAGAGVADPGAGCCPFVVLLSLSPLPCSGSVYLPVIVMAEQYSSENNR